MKIYLHFLLFLFASRLAVAQTPVEGYTFEQNNRGYLGQVKIVILELPANIVRAELETDTDGHFNTALQPGAYRLQCKKDLFFDLTDTLVVARDKQFLKLEMRRRPGYLLDATISEARETPAVVVDGITGARVEIFNRTTQRPELSLIDHPNAFFQFTLEQGNHYTIMIRKPGFIAKRIEAYVNVEGCIICVDGVRELSPGITENLTAGNTMGTLLSNIELDRAKVDKRITIRNIYYDYDKWDIRADAAKQLDKVVTLMKDNPSLSIELGSHTDARGSASYNDTLSQKRAEAAIEYIIGEGIDRARITAKGYGESQLFNRCADGVECSEAEHQLNRRTELRITKVDNDSLEMRHWTSLEDIIREEDAQLERKKKGKPKTVKVEELQTGAKTAPRQRQPEANNSVPTPVFQPESSPADTAGIQMVKQYDDNDFLNISLAIPPAYSGYKIEFVRAKTPLQQKDSRLRAFQPVYLRRDKSGYYCYFAGDFENAAAAQEFYKKDVLPKFPEAKVALFKAGEKTYY